MLIYASEIKISPGVEFFRPVLYEYVCIDVFSGEGSHVLIENEPPGVMAEGCLKIAWFSLFTYSLHTWNFTVYWQMHIYSYYTALGVIFHIYVAMEIV